MNDDLASASSVEEKNPAVEPAPAVTAAQPNGMVPPNLDHLDDRIKPLTAAPMALRIKAILSDVMIVHPTLLGVLNEIEWLIREPKRQRARGLVVVGQSGSGKSAIVEYTQKKYPADTDVKSDKPRVVAISLSGARKTKDVLGRVLGATGAPLSRKLTTTNHELIVVETLRQMNCRLLILDEANDILQIAEREQIRVLETIKYLMNTLHLPVLALGTEPARNAFRADPHLQARFEFLDIPPWEAGDDFREFLVALERCLPLKQPSNLSSEEIQKMLVKATKGVLSKILERVRFAAVNAAADGTERITKEALKGPISRPNAEVLDAK